MIFFNLPALMDDDDNEGRDGILCVLFVLVYYRSFKHSSGTIPQCHLVVEFGLSLYNGFVTTGYFFFTTLM